MGSDLLLYDPVWPFVIRQQSVKAKNKAKNPPADIPDTELLHTQKTGLCDTVEARSSYSYRGPPRKKFGDGLCAP